MGSSNQKPQTMSHSSPKEQDFKTDITSSLWLAFFLLAFLLVDIASINTNFVRAGLETPWPQIILMETSGVFAAICSIPLIALAAGRVPPEYTNWYFALPAHIIFSLVISFIFLAIMISVRKLLSPVVIGEIYLIGDNWLREFFYEYRKIALFYIISLFFMVLARQISVSRQALEAAVEDARTSQKISLNSGGRVVSLEAVSIIHVKAAANYYEITTTDAAHFIRGTLSHLQRILINTKTPFIQVHRSHVINADCITTIQPDGEGGLEISLSNGATIPCSRTYRKNIEKFIEKTAL